MVTSVTDIKVTKGGHDYTYHEYNGLSTDTKPTTGVFNGSKFHETDSRKVFIFDGTNLQWKVTKNAEWFKPIASAPTTGNDAGDALCDPTTLKVYMWDGTQWREV